MNKRQRIDRLMAYKNTHQKLQLTVDQVLPYVSQGQAKRLRNLIQDNKQNKKVMKLEDLVDADKKYSTNKS